MSSTEPQTENTLKEKSIVPPSEFEVSPYQPPTTPVTELMDEEDFQLAGRGIRLLAYFADATILLFSFAAVFALVPLLGGSIEESDDMIMGLAMLLIGGIVIINWILLYHYGQTIGKRLLSIKIVRTDGSRAGLLRIIFLRYIPTGLLSSIPFIGFLFALLDPLLIFQESRRCLHDLIADTIVIDAFHDGSTRRSTTALIAVSIIPVLIIVGILAAVAIPAYVDYMNKAKVAEAAILFKEAKTEVETYIANTGQFPSTENLEDLTTSGQYVASLELNYRDSYIQTTMKEDGSVIAGKTIRWTYDQYADDWTCRAGSPNGMDNKYLPRRCKQQ